MGCVKDAPICSQIYRKTQTCHIYSLWWVRHPFFSLIATRGSTPEVLTMIRTPFLMSPHTCLALITPPPCCRFLYLYPLNRTVITKCWFPLSVTSERLPCLLSFIPFDLGLTLLSDYYYSLINCRWILTLLKHQYTLTLKIKLNSI